MLLSPSTTGEREREGGSGHCVSAGLSIIDEESNIVSETRSGMN